MNARTIFMILVFTALLISSGCSSNQAQVTTSPIPLPTDTATITPSPTSTSTPLPTSTSTPIPNDGKYRPPQANYACDFSDKTTQGAASRFRVNEYYLPESYETVLSNDFGDWYSIEFLRISDEFLPLPEDVEQRKEYLDSDLNAFMERRIGPDIPDGEIVEQEYLQKDPPVLLAILELPGGSNMTANGTSMDATRAVYIVSHGGYGYVISTQFTDIFSTKQTREEIIEQLKANLDEFYESCAFVNDPEVGRYFVQPTITPIPDPMDFIPDMKIQEGSFFPEKGSENLDPLSGGEILTKGDWILYRSTMESVLPVPKGWTTIETGQQTYILFSPTGDPRENPVLQITLNIYGYEDDSITSEKPIADSLASIEQSPNFTLVKKEIMDEDKGYIFLKVITDAGTTRYVLQVVSKYANNPSGKFFHVATVFANEEDWDQYYPIIQAMLGNWHAYDGASIAIPLPETLTE
jgi:hypothetical protein